MDHVHVAGLRIAFERRGTGPPLFLLHGAVCDGRVWRRQLDELSDTFTVIAWDAPGCGASSDPPPEFRMPDYGACLAAFVDALSLDRVHVLGHSWGSVLALELFRQRRACVRSLILVGAYAGWAGSLAPAEVERRLEFALHFDPASEGFDPATMTGLFSDAMPGDRAAELRQIMSEIRPAGTATMAHALAEADLRDVLPRIDVPVLLLYGDADERSPLSVAEALHQAIEGSTLAVMPGLGHECHLESADRFETEVRSFLTSLGT
jgi:pimeloyl-ACP methyl ester carboxylesterase